jgi:hypothetical protein
MGAGAIFGAARATLIGQKRLFAKDSFSAVCLGDRTYAVEPLNCVP